MIPLSLEDTIAAIASPPGGALRGVVRLSGPDALSLLGQVCERLDAASFPRRAACLAADFKLPGQRHRLEVELLVWPDARSYTGQPSAEIHTLGSPPLLQAMLETLCAAGARPATPGEFTLRAVLNGKLDLTQAEAVLGVIHAQEDRELNVALDQLAGGFGGPLRSLREELLDTLAHLEAGLDFVEEEIEFVTRDTLLAQLGQAREEVSLLLRRLESRGLSAELPRVVLAGPPNAGKSSLFNALVGHAAAIVSQVAGTTRDYLTATLSLDGVPCQLIDTTGWEHELHGKEASASIASLAQQQTAVQQASARLTILCVETGQALDAALVERFSAQTRQSLVVETKCDTAIVDRKTAVTSSDVLLQAPVVSTSSKTGAGLDSLRRAIRAALVEFQGTDLPVVAATAVRCRDSLLSAQASLSAARQAVELGEGDELVAAELRIALDALGEVVGAVYTDDILDRIFTRFCIGK